MTKTVSEFEGYAKKKLAKVVGNFGCELDTKFQSTTEHLKRWVLLQRF